MITALIRNGAQYELKRYPGPVRIKTPAQCLCECCDIDCASCTASAPCLHHAEGEGGMCISRQVAETADGLGRWERVAWHQHVLAYTDCCCDDDEECEHAAEIREFYQQLTDPRPRRAGSQRSRVASPPTTGDRQ